MGREPVVLGAQAAEVDDPRHPGSPRCLGKTLRGESVGAFEIDPLVHRMDEPIGDLDPSAGLDQRGRVGRIPDNDADARPERCGRGANRCPGVEAIEDLIELARLADEAANLMPTLEKRPEETAPHVARGASEEDVHGTTDRFRGVA